jgi:threonine synthase
VPRIVAVQAAGAAPFARAFDEGFATRHTVRAETVATAIRIGDPASWGRAVTAIEETDGLVLALTDEEILAAKSEVDGCGVGCEPASAAAVGGVKELARRGLVRPGETVVAVLTGHILKDPGILLEYHRDREPPPSGANRPMEIDPSLSDVERVLSGTI